VLFGPGATYSFVAYKAVGKLGKSPSGVGKWFTISTPLGKHVDIDIIYMGIKLEIIRCETRVDLIPLGIHDFDIILGMDWLGKYKAQMDCFAKTVTFYGFMGVRVVFRGERNVIPNCLIFAMTAQKMTRKGCEVYLLLVVDVHGRKRELASIPIVREFSDVFLEELPGLPPEKEVEVSIDTLPGTSPIAQAPYRMVLTELAELKNTVAGIVRKWVHTSK
jgi:hypothetical protein